MGYPVPSDESERLRAMASFDVLDTALDPVFDDIVQLAAIVCRVPIAVVSFITEDRQIVRARVGTHARTTMRDVAFCAHAICQSELFVVTDASSDERFSDHPNVVGDPHIRFYAGMPIQSPTRDCILGTVCVIDRKPRMLTTEQNRALEILARQATAHLYDPIHKIGRFARAAA